MWGRMGSMNSIGVNAAARKYGIPASTISSWLRAGMIRVAERRGQTILMVDADVAALAANYEPGAGRGKRARLAASVLG